jgi:O-antigen ligase
VVHRIRSQDPHPDALGRLSQPQRVLTWTPAAARVRDGALVALAIGLAASISLSEIALAVLTGCVLLRATRDGIEWPLALPIGLFLAWTATVAVASERPVESLLAARSSVWLLAIIVLANAFPDASAARRWLMLLFACIAIVSALSIVQVAVCPETAPAVPVLRRFLRRCHRAHAFYSIYMTLGGVLLLVLTAVLPGLLRHRTALAWTVPGWMTGVAALALTQVRSAWLGFVIGVLGTLHVMRRRAVVLAIVAAVLLAALALPGVAARVRTIGRMDDPTTRDRLAMLTGGLRIARDHPWIGIGPGAVKHVYPVYAPPQALRRSTSHLHNSPLQILVERGVIGLVLWLAVFAAFFVRAVRVFRSLRADAPEARALVAGSIAAVAAFLVAGLFEYNFGDTEVLLVACSVMALPFVVGNREARSRAD